MKNFPVGYAGRYDVMGEPEYDPGKAAARDAYFAGKGGLATFRADRFGSKGQRVGRLGESRALNPARRAMGTQRRFLGTGETWDEANADFEKLYAGASPEVIGKYDRRAGVREERVPVSPSATASPVKGGAAAGTPKPVAMAAPAVVTGPAAGLPGGLQQGPPDPASAKAAFERSNQEYGRIADQRKAENYAPLPPGQATASPVARAPRINPLTGMPLGALPGDAVYDASKKPLGTGREMTAPQATARDVVAADRSIRSQAGADYVSRNAVPVSPATAARPAFRSALDDPNNAFSNAAHARTAAARAEGLEKQRIRDGVMKYAARPDFDYSKSYAELAAQYGVR